jgi:hypothetical protein
MELFQRTDKKDLDHASPTDADITGPISSDQALSCDLVNTDGATVETVTYHYTDYPLSDKKLGANQTTYSRTVTLDDLANQVLATGQYQIQYEFTSAQSTRLESNGYTETSEGSYVKYDATGHVISIACEAVAANNYTDPNTVSLGYIQNLDSAKVAIIQGVASNFDSQAETELYALKMQNLKTYNPAAYEQAMEHIAGDNIFSSSSFAESVNKMTKISIEKTTDDSANECYKVSCDVYYEDTYAINGVSVPTDKISYNVYSQYFYTNQAPDIYFIYEPFVDISTATTVQYNANDYIMVYNDEASSTSKLYLIKPDNSQLTAKGAATGVDSRVYYTRVSGLYTPVKVNVNYLKVGDTSPLKIYTNLLLNGSAEVNSTSGTVTGSTINQFNTALNTAVPSMEMPSVAGVVRAAYPDGYIQSINDDTNSDGRLYTITVTLKTSDGNTVRFQGAKGAN